MLNVTSTGTTTTGVTTSDGIRLHAESTGDGAPLLFLHEFAGDHRSWEPQVRYFSARYRCVTYAARGYPPSGVPDDPAAYSQERAVADAVDVLDGLGIPAAHVVGLSMGGFAALHLTLRRPDRVLSTVAAGTGYGAAPERQDAFRAECEAIAVAFENEGSEQVARWYAVGPARVQFQNKNPRGWAEFADALAGHSALGSALTMRGVQAGRPSLYALRDELAAISTQAHHSDRGAGRAAAHRAHREPGGAAPVQRGGGPFPGLRRARRLGRPRPAQPVLLHDRGEPFMTTVNPGPRAPLIDRDHGRG
jgi:pimeloyl-ACP methyl ester carboxylesterase